MMSWVKKPLLGRGGANITLHRPGQDLETGGGYGAEGFIYQEAARLPETNGRHGVVGSWLIGHETGKAAAGIGIHESNTPISTHASRFVPHLFG